METISYQDIHRPLVERCRLGEQKAQYELYKLYSKAMFNICMRIANDYAEAEDILQESFLSAFQHIQTFKGDSTFGAWLKKIVVNQSIAHIKKKRLQLIPLEEQDMPQEDETVYEEEVVLQVEGIKRAIQKLPDGYRVVLSLYLLENKST